jgi:hypothetical protein
MSTRGNRGNRRWEGGNHKKVKRVSNVMLNKYTVLGSTKSKYFVKFSVFS